MGELDGQTTDYIAIRRLQDAYADVVSRRAFDELHDLFLPAAPVMIELPGGTREVVGPGDFGRYVEKRIAGLEFFQFVILNAVVELAVDGDPDRARARIHMCELRQDRAEGRSPCSTACTATTTRGSTAAGGSRTAGSHRWRSRSETSKCSTIPSSEPDGRRKP